MGKSHYIEKSFFMLVVTNPSKMHIAAFVIDDHLNVNNMTQRTSSIKTVSLWSMFTFPIAVGVFCLKIKINRSPFTIGNVTNKYEGLLLKPI